MSYTKVIRYGDNIETYDYEHSPPPHKIGLIKKDRPKPDEEEIFKKRKDNVLQAKRNFRRLVGANLSGEKPLLITVTHKENMDNITVGYRNYKSFVQALRYKYDKELNYIVVPEFQERGAVHFHALFWGLPSDVLLPERLTGYYENVSPTLSKIWNYGLVFLKETDGHGKLSSYLAKYMAKAFVDRRLKNQKAYASSRHIKRPFIDTMTLPTFYQYLEENDLPIIDKTYKTKWMGQCRHRWFKVKNQVI
jgi:hypothetical protein